jgi:predicted amidohydrolase YtcJ
MKQIALLLAVSAVLASCATTPSPRADLVLTGGRVFTGDDSRPWAEGVAIRGDSIVAVGTDAEVRALATDATRVVSLDGKVVIPGINDAHVHAPWPRMAEKSVRTPREGLTRESLLAAVRVAATDATQPLAGELPLELVDAGITRDDLDAISTTVPIRLGVFGGHSAILNTPALRAWGIAEDAQDPPGGTYGRTDGRLNGWLYEHAYWTPQFRFAATATDDELRRQVIAFEDEALSYGITSVQTMAILPAKRLDAVLKGMSPRIRWRVMDFRMAPYDASPAPYPVKYVLDGTPIERSAATIDAYADASTRGMLNYTEDEIGAMVRDAARGERQLLVHAVGDRAIATLFDAMERTPTDWPARRVRLEHGDLLSPALAERAKKLGVVLVQNPAHFTIPHVMTPRYGATRAGQSQPARSLVHDGQRFAIGSDGPLNPFLNIFFSVIHPTNQAESLTVEQAVRAYTSGAAFAEMTEAKKGRIAAGMVADLAVLSQDIFSVPPPELPKTKSVMTIVGGKVAWEAQ